MPYCLCSGNTTRKTFRKKNFFFSRRTTRTQRETCTKTWKNKAAQSFNRKRRTTGSRRGASAGRPPTNGINVRDLTKTVYGNFVLFFFCKLCWSLCRSNLLPEPTQLSRFDGGEQSWMKREREKLKRNGPPLRKVCAAQCNTVGGIKKNGHNLCYHDHRNISQKNHYSVLFKINSCCVELNIIQVGNLK